MLSEKPRKSRVSEGSKKHVIRVNNELLANIVKIRETINTYQTGRLLKIYAFYLNLKTLTTSGVIKNITKPSPELLKLCKCSPRTFATRVGELVNEGFAIKNAKNLVLTSQRTLMELYECSINEYSAINVPEGAELTSVLEAHLIRLQQVKQEVQFERNIKKVPEVFEYLKKNLPHTNNLRETILEAQQNIFKHGNNNQEFTSIVNKYNADNNVQARTLRKLFEYKSYKSVAYLKKRLSKNGLIEVVKRKITSEVRSRKEKQYYVSYQQNEKQTTWHLCDKISIVPTLYK